MDQTDWGDRFAVLMISVRCGDRSLPMLWQIETGEANNWLCRATGAAGASAGWVA
ncbi:MAG: hypothetical protein NOF05_06770 [Candidatus Accumulibacter phosphatis]|uniref:Uncharacterized protein n=1 Tax=Candidatus Accumulibacter phosphatis TaxID=327160 RepID=A0A5S4EGV9_9PROT|nr:MULTISPECIES: hypothetical protein [Candidatus Accumulibacter]MCM8580291.1 hypothetical protein [Accumulibacter sp.]MCQ1548518.1 hypothetical protein [Candidatus Accumulibacter phosphatis]TMQ74517.1 hypothetical protein ACCUM_0051 [Candidatus Accumulibacter phosphatis]